MIIQDSSKNLAELCSMINRIDISIKKTRSQEQYSKHFKGVGKQMFSHEDLSETSYVVVLRSSKIKGGIC